MGFLVLTLNIGNRDVKMFFDGSPRPGLILFHNRTFRQMASNQRAPENLRHFAGNGEGYIQLEGFRPNDMLYFNGMPLESLDVFSWNTRAPSGIRGIVSMPFFKDYLMVFDYKNERFGLARKEVLSK